MTQQIDTKLALVLLLWVVALMYPWWIHLAALAATVALVLRMPSWKPFDAAARALFFKFFRFAILVSIAVVLLNGLLMRGGTSHPLGVVTLHDEGVSFGVRTVARLLLLTFSILAFFASTRLRDFSDYLEHAGLPRTLVSILLLSLFYLEHLPRRIRQIFTAQESRGLPVRSGLANRSRALIALLAPLVLSTLVESVERGIALDLRGYHLQSGQRTRKETGPVRSTASRLILGVTFLLLAGKVVSWLFL